MSNIHGKRYYYFINYSGVSACYKINCVFHQASDVISRHSKFTFPGIVHVRCMRYNCVPSIQSETLNNIDSGIRQIKTRLTPSLGGTLGSILFCFEYRNMRSPLLKIKKNHQTTQKFKCFCSQQLKKKIVR